MTSISKHSQTLHDITIKRRLVDPSKAIQSSEQGIGVQMVSVLYCMIHVAATGVR